MWNNRFKRAASITAPSVPAQVKRTSTNPYGWFNDEFTKQTLDLKEGFDCVNEAAGAGLDLPGFVQPNQWPEGQVSRAVGCRQRRAPEIPGQPFALGWLWLQPAADRCPASLEQNLCRLYDSAPPAPRSRASSQPGFKTAMMHCLDEFAAASFRVLEALAIGLGLPPHTLRPYFEASRHTDWWWKGFDGSVVWVWPPLGCPSTWDTIGP